MDILKPHQVELMIRKITSIPRTIRAKLGIWIIKRMNEWLCTLYNGSSWWSNRVCYNFIWVLIFLWRFFILSSSYIISLINLHFSCIEWGRNLLNIFQSHSKFPLENEWSHLNFISLTLYLIPLYLNQTNNLKTYNIMCKSNFKFRTQPDFIIHKWIDNWPQIANYNF